MKLIQINQNSSIPKYKQVILSVEMAIAENRLKKNDKLPSVNKVSIANSVSRDTVLLAYEELKKRGIIYAILGKGYYVKSEEFSFEQRYFLLFDELNSFKEDLYNSFLQNLENKAQVDIFFHHFNVEMFKKLIHESNGNYSKYIIMPSNLQETGVVIKSLPFEDVYILDQTNDELILYPSITQNFTRDMYKSLVFGIDKIKKYNQLILIFPGKKEPIGMVEGFLNFCKDYNINHSVISEFEDNCIMVGTVYIIPNDRDLVQVIEQSKAQNLKLGKDFGIISYNDTPLKKVVANGITTISTDFKKMGNTLAKMLLTHQKDKIENECNLIIRNSL